MKNTCGIATLLSCALAAGLEGQTGLPYVLPADFETRAALAAAPAQLRDGAGVFLLGEEGYYRARESTNGFNCLIERGVEREALDRRVDRQLFAPQCFDDEATRSLVAFHVDRSHLIRSRGLSRAQADSAMNANAMRYVSRRTGIVYMASALNTLNNPDDMMEGAYINYVPHIMFLAPYIPNERISGQGPRVSLDQLLEGWPFMPGPSRVEGLIIVPLDRGIQAQVREEQQDLARELERYVPRNTVYMK